jgi:hypothetical protein
MNLVTNISPKKKFGLLEDTKIFSVGHNKKSFKEQEISQRSFVEQKNKIENSASNLFIKDFISPEGQDQSPNEKLASDFVGTHKTIKVSQKTIKVSECFENSDPQGQNNSSDPQNQIFSGKDLSTVYPVPPSNPNCYFEGSPFGFNVEVSSVTGRENLPSAKPRVQSESMLVNENAASKFFPNRNLFNEFKSINSVNHLVKTKIMLNN